MRQFEKSLTTSGSERVWKMKMRYASDLLVPHLLNRLFGPLCRFFGNAMIFAHLLNILCILFLHQIFGVLPAFLRRKGTPWSSVWQWASFSDRNSRGLLKMLLTVLCFLMAVIALCTIKHYLRFSRDCECLQLCIRQISACEHFWSLRHCVWSESENFKSVLQYSRCTSILDGYSIVYREILLYLRSRHVCIIIFRL